MFENFLEFLRDNLILIPGLVAAVLVTYALRRRGRFQNLGLKCQGTNAKSSLENAGDPVKVEFGPCCFCGKDVEETQKEPCQLVVETRDGHWQMWVCHAQCFRDRIFEDSLLAPVHF